MAKPLTHTVTLVLAGSLARQPERQIEFACSGEAEAIAKAKELMAQGYWCSNRYMTQVVLPHTFVRIEIYPALLEKP